MQTVRETEVLMPTRHPGYNETSALKRKEGGEERTSAMRNNMFEDLPYDDPPAIDRQTPIIAGMVGVTITRLGKKVWTSYYVLADLGRKSKSTHWILCQRQTLIIKIANKLFKSKSLIYSAGKR